MFFELGFPTATVWGWLKDAAPNAGYAIAAVLLAVLLFVIVALVLLQATTRFWWLRWIPPSKQVLRPTLQIKPLHDDALPERLGPPVAGLIRGRVRWQRDRFGLNLVSGQAGVASALSGLAKAGDQAKAAVAVIDLLTAVLPRRHFVVNGELQPAGAHGVGISLELGRGTGFAALITFWADAFGLAEDDPEPVAYQHLAVPAAAWVDFHLARSIDDKDLLTGDPESWASSRSGVEWQRLGEPGRARTLYEQALAKDGTNVGALANLGILSRRERLWRDAESYLKRARDQIEPDPSAFLSSEQNPDWYRIEYQFAALELSRAVAEGSEDGRKNAVKHATGLARTVLATIAADPGLLSSNRNKRYFAATLEPFLVGTIEPGVLILIASGIVAKGSQPPTDWREKPPTRAQILDLLASEPSDPWPLIAYVEHNPHRPAAVQYNLACFYAHAGDYIKAARWLMGAVRETPRPERRALFLVAEQDPALKRLISLRCGILAHLKELLSSDPLSPEEEAQKRHFDLQDLVHDGLRRDGWRVVDWTGDGTRVVLHASNPRQEWLLVEMAGSKALSQDDIDGARGRLTKFRSSHTGPVSVRIRLVVPRDAEELELDVSVYCGDDVEVHRERADGGFEPLTPA